MQYQECLHGILNKFGKIGVVVGFALGNVLLAYVSNGYSVELIHFKEILIASIGLLAIPNNIHIELEEFIGKTKLLPVTPDRALNRSKEVAENLNNVSDAIQEIATTYNNVEDVSYDANKKIFIAELLNNLEPYKENILYEDIADIDGKILDQIFKFLLDKQEIKKEDLIEIFKRCNSYIIGIEDKEINGYLKESIEQIIRTINTSYKICKSNFIWQRKIEQANKNAKKQLNNVSKAIHGMAQKLENTLESEKEFEIQKEEIIIKIDDISIHKKVRFFVEMYLSENEETKKIKEIEKILSKVLKESIVLDEETVGTHLRFLSDDKYDLYISNSEAAKSGSEVSGDSLTTIRLKDGNYLIALSDGMGTGGEAKSSSEKALRMLENLLLSGFDKNTSLELINTGLIANDIETYATLDIAIMDLYQGKVEFIKSGACPSYIKNKKKVQIVKANSLPTGIVEESNLNVYDRDIQDNDILLMCTDGILDSNIEYKNKELWLKYMLEDIETENTRKIADLILSEAIDNTFGKIKDDLSIVVCRFKKSQKSNEK